MTDHDAQLMQRVMTMYRRLLKAADWKQGMGQGDLDVVAVAAMDLLATALAYMTEPTRSERTKLFSEGAAANFAKRREWVEGKKHPPVKH